MVDLYTVSLSIASSAVALCALSFLWKENYAWRMLEAVVVGVAVGHVTVFAFVKVYNSGFSPLVAGKFELFIPVILGLMFYLRYYRETRWISRIPMSIVFGVPAGLAIRAALHANILMQMTGLMAPLTSFNQIIMFIAAITVCLYFVFTFKYEGAYKYLLNYPGKVGRYFIMIYMGGAFTVFTQSRFVVLQETIKIAVVSPGIYLIPIAVVLLVAAIARERKAKTE